MTRHVPAVDLKPEHDCVVPMRSTFLESRLLSEKRANE